MIFDALWKDLLFAVLFGIIGGFVVGWVDGRDIELPRKYTKNGATHIDAGILQDIALGMVAAVVLYILNSPADILGLIAVGLTGGLAGSAVLRSLKNSAKAEDVAKVAEGYQRTLAKVAAGELDSNTLRDAIKKRDSDFKAVRTRWRL